LLALVAFAGCGDPAGEGKDTVPVTGKVTLDGTAVGGATIVFSPAGGGTDAATAISNPDGTYSLQGQFGEEGEGAVPGTYKVTVTKIEGAAAEGEDVDEDTAYKDMEAAGGPEKEPPPAKNLLPEKYADASTSGFEFEVKADDDNVFDLPLTRE
jgi:hypothetical protein